MKRLFRREKPHPKAVNEDGWWVVRRDDAEGEATVTVEKAMPQKQGTVEEAVRFLERELADGPAPSTTVQAKARDAGISPSTLKRAKKRSGVKSFKSPDGWLWELPEEANETDESEGTQHSLIIHLDHEGGQVGEQEEQEEAQEGEQVDQQPHHQEQQAENRSALVDAEEAVQEPAAFALRIPTRKEPRGDTREA